MLITLNRYYRVSARLVDVDRAEIHREVGADRGKLDAILVVGFGELRWYLHIVGREISAPQHIDHLGALVEPEGLDANVIAIVVVNRYGPVAGAGMGDELLVGGVHRAWELLLIEQAGVEPAGAVQGIPHDLFHIDRPRARHHADGIGRLSLIEGRADAATDAVGRHRAG